MNVSNEEVNKFSQLSSKWWDLQGELSTLHDINPTRIAFIEQFLTLKDKNVLDLGCGGGILTEGLAKKGAIMTGLDASFELIEVAKAHAITQSLSITYHHGLVEAFESPLFDVIVCMEMLEHVPDPHAILSACKRLLKPDGLLFLSTLNRTPTAFFKAIVLGEYVLDLLPRETHSYESFIKPSELRDMLESMDFSVMDIQGLSYQPFLKTATLTDDVSVNYLMVAKRGS
jgi:2-polyprenyl-6-hydroxyphenyl methylase/3-demethylubiquinone-9 3-methyltransferase